MSRAAGTSGTLLADGYSCRSQAKLIDGVRLLHPVQALLAAVRNPITVDSRAEPTSRDADSAGLHQTPVDAEAAQTAAHWGSHNATSTSNGGTRDKRRQRGGGRA